MNFKALVVDVLVRETKLDATLVEDKLEVPPDHKLGDYAFPCFLLAKEWKKVPAQIAKDLADKLNLPKELQTVEANGPYLNLFVNKTMLIESTLKAIAKQQEKFGNSKTDKETIMVEFFHANTHKGVHIGHLRNIATGAAICNLLEAVGKKVIRVNYQGDIGPHVAKGIWGYQHAKDKVPKTNRGIWLGQKYAEGSQAAKDDKSVEAEIKELNTKIYQHDPSVEKIWQETRQWCLDDFEKFYQEFGVKYDALFFESEAGPVGKEEFKKLLDMGVAKESDGAIIVDLEKYKLAVYVAITSQGNPTYQGKEIGLARLKQDQFKFDKSIHVVGSEQELFFKQVFKTYELMKSPMAGISTHVSYGLVSLPEGKMSSRLGTMILYENLYQELFALAKQEVAKRHPQLSDKEVEQRAKFITFGALKFSMLARENHKNMVFEWDKALDFEGDTGPYVQYAHARCASILRKAKESIKPQVKYDSLSTDSEYKLVSQLAKFPTLVETAALAYKPYQIAFYLLELAQLFSEFYHHCPVISDEKEVMQARLLLVQSTKQVLANGLGLLGIIAPDEM